jgi:UDP-N-acetylmuramate dehydrogenase
MTILENVSLKQYSTMRLGGTARFACEVQSEQELKEALQYADMNMLAWRVIGTGSNIVWKEEGFSGLLIINRMEGFEILEDSVTVRIGAGMDWDAAVEKTVEAHLSGIEFLSYIPGTAGATPVQNVGAYGREISEVLVSLRAYDSVAKDFVELRADQCAFGYRTSRFKTVDAGLYIITSITLKLSQIPAKPPFYESLQAYLDEHRITDYSPASIRRAVIAVRTTRMPDPAETANNGSFFANPVISNETFKDMQAHYPDIKGWPSGNGMKVSAAWLIEAAGFKDYHDAETGMATWDKQSLVLINEHAQTTADLLKFKQKIVDAVHAKFLITLEQEPELLP